MCCRKKLPEAMARAGSFGIVEMIERLALLPRQSPASLSSPAVSTWQTPIE